MESMSWLCAVLLHLNVISSPGSYTNCELYEYEYQNHSQIQLINTNPPLRATIWAEYSDDVQLIEIDNELCAE